MRLGSEIVDFDLLANHPEHVGLVAPWLFGEWGDAARGQSSEQLEAGLRSRISTNSLPMHLLAMKGGVPIGFAALKLHEMGEFPQREHWLGSLFVLPEDRGLGIGGALIEEIVRRASERGVGLLSLQTERLDGGVYRHLGWVAVEKFRSRGDEVLIMERRIC